MNAHRIVVVRLTKAQCSDLEMLKGALRSHVPDAKLNNSALIRALVDIALGNAGQRTRDVVLRTLHFNVREALGASKVRRGRPDAH